jgi:hypothetical protein
LGEVGAGGDLLALVVGRRDSPRVHDLAPCSVSMLMAPMQAAKMAR